MVESDDEIDRSCPETHIDATKTDVEEAGKVELQDGNDSSNAVAVRDRGEFVYLTLMIINI